MQFGIYFRTSFFVLINFKICWSHYRTALNLLQFVIVCNSFSHIRENELHKTKHASWQGVDGYAYKTSIRVISMSFQDLTLNTHFCGQPSTQPTRAMQLWKILIPLYVCALYCKCFWRDIIHYGLFFTQNNYLNTTLRVRSLHGIASL